MAEIRILFKKICPNCGREFTAENSRKKYCSEQCYRQFNSRVQAKRLRERSLNDGLCIRCRKAPALPNQTRCAACIERDKAIMKKYNASRGNQKQCKIFNCDHFHGNRCCYFCRKRNNCPEKRSGPCLNSPDVCGEYLGNKLKKGATRNERN